MDSLVELTQSLLTQVINLAQRTCDMVHSQCVRAVQTGVNKLLAIVTAFAAELTRDLTGAPAGPTMPPVNLPDMCGGTMSAPGDCKQFLCHHMLDGFASNNWLDWSVLESALAALGSTESTGAQVTGAGGDMTVDEVSSRVAAAPQRIMAALRLPVAAVTGHNVYVAHGGYDAYAVGCQQTEGCKSTVGLVPYAAVLIALAVVCVLGGGACLLFRRRRKGYGRV